MAAKNSENSKDSGFALGKENLKFLGIGFIIIIIGFIVMIGGGAEDSKSFSPKIFDAQRIIIAPIIVVFGFLFEIWAIMKKPKE
jgi:hypothetical protein